MTTSLKDGAIFADRFEIERLVERGGMGTVYCARDRATGDRVALKLLDITTEERAVAIERFTREAGILEELRLPGVVAHIAHGASSEGQLFLAMQWLEGEDLGHRLRRGPLGLRDAMLLLERVARALSAAHERGIIHRDLKPNNLFLPGGDVAAVTLLDFGIARYIARRDALTRTGLLVGTPRYMSPEQARSSHDIRPATDIFALGCVVYECLTGQTPFEADHVAAILGRILFDQPSSVRLVRPAVPEAWAALISRMLEKDPEKRPRDAAALLTEIRALPEARTNDEAPTLGGDGSEKASWEGAEQHLVSVVLARPHRSTSSDDRPPSSTETAVDLASADKAASAIVRFGAQVEWLADGSLIATVMPRSSAKDQAVVAARCALALRDRLPAWRIAVATGRGVLGKRVPVGDAIDRVARLIESRARAQVEERPHAQDGIWLDEVTAGLLDARFGLAEGPEGAILEGERVPADEARPLLGKPTACFGREQELAQLEGTFDQCIEEPMAQAVLVTGPPGIGKSRLRYELLRRLKDKGEPLEILIGHGDPLTAGSPYGLLGQAIRRRAGVHLGDDPAVSREALTAYVRRHIDADHEARVSAFLGELCGLHYPDEDSPPLKAARSDPRAMNEHIANAFIDWLRAECAAAPVFLLLEDMQWGDALTVKLLGAALRDLAEQPLFVMALARPELAEQHPKLWSGYVHEIGLRPLSRKASERLVKSALGERPSGPSVIARIVEQAAGNALFLEELIRAAAEGKADEVPETVLAMLQARLVRLPADVRRALRMASVLGETFWAGAMRLLCEQGAPPVDVTSCLSVLVEAELVEQRRQSRFPGEAEYGFRHALLRDAAYSLLTEADRKQGHKLAGLYLAQMGGANPIELAEHARCGGDLAQAAVSYLRAAEQSLERNDLAEALARARKGQELGALGEVRGGLCAVQALASFGLADWAGAGEIGSTALTLLPRGGLWWCRVAEKLFIILPTLDHLDRYQELVRVFSEVEPAPEARSAHVYATSYLVGISALMGARDDAYRYLKLAEEKSASILDRDLYARGWLAFFKGFLVRWVERDPHLTLRLGEESVRDCAATGAARDLCFPKTLLGVARQDLGDLAGGEEALRGSLASAEEARDPYYIVNAQSYLGLLLCERGDPGALDEAEVLANRVLEAQVSKLYMGHSHVTLGWVWFARGRVADAEVEARRAYEEMRIAPAIALMPLSLLIEILVSQGRAGDAKAAAEEGFLLYSKSQHVGFCEVPFLVSAAEARRAAGDIEGSRAALEEALRQIEARAAGIPDASQRELFRIGRPECRRASELARAWSETAGG
jgi:serine/threonine protein kinase